MSIFKNKIVILVRHGERADLVDGMNPSLLRCGRYDSELTQAGKDDAVKAGEKIAEFLEERIKIEFPYNTSLNLKHLHFAFLSSPFARTISTASHLLLGMNLHEKFPVIIENGLCEKLNEKWYPEHPMNFLVLYKNSQNIRKRHLLADTCNCELVDNRSLSSFPKYPETKEDFKERINKFYDSTMKRYLSKCDVLIASTHFLAVAKLCQRFIKKEKIPVQYCITHAFRYSERNKDGNLIHLRKLYP